MSNRSLKLRGSYMPTPVEVRFCLLNKDSAGSTEPRRECQKLLLIVSKNTMHTAEISLDTVSKTLKELYKLLIQGLPQRIYLYIYKEY